MSYQTITPPSDEPVTLAQAKAQCRVDSAEEDDFIESLIQPARELAEHRTGRALMTQTLEWAIPDLAGDKIPFPVSPVQSIESIKYIDSNGVEQTLSPSVYALDKTGQGKHYLRLKNGQSWPSANTQFDAVKVTFVAGYGDAAAVPAAIKQWILMAVSFFYKHRETASDESVVTELPATFCDGLLQTVKIWGL
ncbi:MAG TPA: head-tail connector protein [Methylophilus sp.]|uniref:head-tail connector protein n=1 Tax=Methylophilus sp. TaxID=29541 RepID=UPI002BBA95CA|nr:head-tail connector protein [Methylophilus sp.]HSH86886.1 head-tail connector protein [Methylophilus sp.]